MTDVLQKKVSVIVPVYNGAEFVSRCAESLTLQSWRNLEILFVDDGSTDGTPDLLPRSVRVLSTGGRKGAGFARNLGAQEAAGEVLFFTDADCVLPPDWVEKGMSILAEQDVACAGGGYSGPVHEGLVPEFAHEELLYRRRHFFGAVPTLVSNNLYCRRDVFLKVGGFPIEYRAASSEDMEFSWRLSQSQRLWWDPGNGVFHDFASTIPAYLRQQVRFARDAVPMMLRNRGLARGKSHHGKQIYVETVLTGLFWMAVFLLKEELAGLLLCALLVTNMGFLVFLRRRGRSPRRLLQSFGIVCLRNSAVVWGMCCGAVRLVTHP